MLAEANPRGCPGVLVERVELQRAAEGHPLDDVIVCGVTSAGEQAVLEVQVKRTVTFAPTDRVFKDVVKQLAQAFSKLDLTYDRHQFAVATNRTSHKITGPYQDVLRWAREVGSAATFIERKNRRGAANDDMRTFVDTVSSHLAAAGCSNDDETVWQILRRFQILTFDFDAPGSQSLELAHVRARHVLEPDEGTRAADLWRVLTETAIRVAASGGELDRAKLLSELSETGSFRVQGSWRNKAPRMALAEAATLAASDLQGTVDGLTLSRTEQINAVHSARDSGGYIEIRGEAGVGKSGVLGMLVRQILTEANAIVLSPERTIPGGWLAFKTALGIDISQQEFLADLASDGGAVLFVDSLDFFDETAKRATVIDLVRAAAEVSNFQVIITARSDFDKDEPNWLPSDAITKLGSGSPIFIKELGTDEIEELKVAKPTLSALLAETHPARAIARNLFRLSRLLEVQGSTDTLRSEVDLLERWWTTADGPVDSRRERARLLADLSDAALNGDSYIETSADPKAISELIASGTLRELALDQLIFRHDVLREWGVAARLHENLARLEQLPFKQTVPLPLARGIELGARLALERADDGERWIEYLDKVSPDGAHPSWRRWSLLAILRSELATELLNRAASLLFRHDGALLRELIRTAIAAESRPFDDILSELGMKLDSVPDGLFGPSNASWARLTLWLLGRRADLPLQILPDVVELFQNLSASLFFADAVTPMIAEALADWLEEIEDAREHRPLGTGQPRFASAFAYHDLYKLAEKVRHAFLLMASRIPERSQRYLQGLLKRQRPDDAIRDIVRFRGTLAQAAPIELVATTLAGLIPKQKGKDKPFGLTRRAEIFTHLDSDFLPSSPAQGPFYELLNAAPDQGLELIRHLVTHAISVLSGGQEPGADGIKLEFPTGSRCFPWKHTYFWSRNAPGCYAVESGLMALEAWSHKRMERGDVPEEVIADILGPEGSSAAFLLVAVDVLISHWPKTKDVIVPFLGAPELLSLERERQPHDIMPKMDLFGFGSVGSREPSGKIQLADLKGRVSRKVPLENLLGNFTFIEGAGLVQLRQLLERASSKLGTPEPEDDFAVPRFMARSALNRTDPANWTSNDGMFAYVTPADEAKHLADLLSSRTSFMEDRNIYIAIESALEDKTKSNTELAERAIEYAQRLEASPNSQGEELHQQPDAIVSAALIVVRDSDDALLDEQEEWARRIFANLFKSGDHDVSREMRGGIRFNPVAIATLGIIHLWHRRGKDTDRDTLLKLAARDNAEAAQGFGAGIQIIREQDSRLIRAALRCALTAQIQPIRRWNEAEDKKSAEGEGYRERVSKAVAAEQAWLRGDAEEPSWPTFPAPAIHVRRRIRIGDVEDPDTPPSTPKQASEELLSYRAALWLGQLTQNLKPDEMGWLTGFVSMYADWTAKANGAGLEAHADVNTRIDEWNRVFICLVAHSLSGFDQDVAAAMVRQVIAVPDGSFYDIITELIPAVDEAYFNEPGLDLDTAKLVRRIVADHLTKTADWRYECNRSEPSVGMRVGPAIGVMFFNNYTSVGGASCYLLDKGIDRVDTFFPQLTRLIEEGSVPFTMLVTMNLLEVSHRPEHLGFFLSSAMTWLRRQPGNAQLWVDGGYGVQLAKWLEAAIEADASLCLASHPHLAQIDEVLARLVQEGVAEAHRVERKLKDSAEGK